MNVAQNVMAASSMRLVGQGYWGLRASSDAMLPEVIPWIRTE